ncbi:unnamed protein product [Orchesella dallaii]|uniref:C2H2-type domain-containing protein n=1 Tax=Orchesella dallaii TaxID=48710 RepID=A0ABP1QIN2_9HEXA
MIQLLISEKLLTGSNQTGSGLQTDGRTDSQTSEQRQHDGVERQQDGVERQPDREERQPDREEPGQQDEEERLLFRGKTCAVCHATFHSVGSMLEHAQRYHRLLYYEQVDRLRSNQVGRGIDLPMLDITQESSAFDNMHVVYNVGLGDRDWSDLMQFITAACKSLDPFMNRLLNEPITFRDIRIPQYRIQFSVKSEYEKGSAEDKVVEEFAISSPLQFIRTGSDIEPYLAYTFAYVGERLDAHTHNGSGWTHIKVLKASITIVRAKAFFGGCSDPQWEKLFMPDTIKEKYRSFVNTINRSVASRKKIEHENDDRCFAHAILCYFERQKIHILSQAIQNGDDKKNFIENQKKKLQHMDHFLPLFKRKSRIVKYKKKELYEKGTPFQYIQDEIRINFKRIVFPMTICQIPIFEHDNPNIGLSIIGYDDERDFHCRLKKLEDRFEIKKKKGSTKDERVREIMKLPKSTLSQKDESENPVNASQLSATVLKKQRTQSIRSRSHPLYHSKVETDHKIALMLMYRGEEGGHFMYIKSVEALFLTNGDRTGKRICLNCLNCFGRTTFEHHSLNCVKMATQKIVMPRERLLKFDRYDRTLKTAFTYALDFECLLPELNTDNQLGNTVKECTHEACGFSWSCFDYNNRVVKCSVFRKNPDKDPDLNVGQQCLEDLLEDADYRKDLVKEWNEIARHTMVMSPEIQAKRDNENYDFSDEECYLCKIKFGATPKEDDVNREVDKLADYIVLHHLHVPGYEALGFTHNSCNLKARIRQQFTVFCHNFTGYDSHLIMTAAKKHIVKQSELMGQNSERITSFTVNNLLRFVDSLSFFGGMGLDRVVESLDKSDFDILKQEIFKRYQRDIDPITDEDVKLLLRKGAYPYKYMNAWARFKEKQLPPIECFYNDLSDEPMDPKIYANAQKVFERFQIKDLGEWHDLYVFLDVLLFTCCLISLREEMFSSFDLCVTHYVSLPQYTMDACLKHTKECIETIQDQDIYMYLERGIRGGFTTCGDTKAAQANNEFCPWYESSKPKSWLLYLDKNNLYGYGLSSELPIGGYKWLSEEELAEVNRDCTGHLKRLIGKEKYGEFLEVSIEYPEELHDRFNSFPPVPFKRAIDESEVSFIQQELGNQLGVGKAAWKCQKMVADLLPKTVICHYKVLNTWLSLGVKITRVVSGLSFIEKAWMKPYIDFNTRKRADAKSKFQINIRKFLNNSLYGKQIMDARKKNHMVLINSPEQALKYSRKPLLKQLRILNQDLSLAVLTKQQITLNSPMGGGVVVLEESKKSMYEFWYNYIKKEFPTASLQYSDTDSVVCKVECDNIYDHMLRFKDFFDMSDYDLSHPIWEKYNNMDHKKEVNFMKDELTNKVMTRFCALKSKMYSYEYVEVDGEGKVNGHGGDKKAKGIGRAAVKHQVRFEHYVDCLENPVQTYTNCKSIRSFNHQLYTLNTRKKCLNQFDNKRFMLCNNISLALGHKDIPLYKNFYEYDRIPIGDYFESSYERNLFTKICKKDLKQSDNVKLCIE